MKNNSFNFLQNIQLFIQKHKILNILRYVYYFLDRVICLFIKKNNEENKKKKVLILANLGLGDAMDFLSVSDKYRKLYPKKEYEITMITSLGINKLLQEETDFDYIYAKNFNEMVLSIKKRIQFLKFINKEHYNILIDIMGPTGCSPSLYLIRASKADNKITLKNKFNSKAPDFMVRKAYTKIYEIDESKISNIEYYNRLFDYISGNKKPTLIKFHKTKVYSINDEIILPKEYYIVFPSASTNVKKWPIERYAEIINRINEKYHIPVLFCGTKIDSEDVNKLIPLIKSKYYNYLGKTSILEFIQIIKKAKFVISNDTSAYHIGVIEEVPTAIISGGYTYDGFVTYKFKNNKYKKPYVIVNKRSCFNCLSNCPYIKNEKIWPCLNAITVDYAWNIIEKMIQEN